MVNRAEVIKSPRHVLDDTLFTLGNDNDVVLVLKSGILNANTALTGVAIGTPVAQAIAANSAILSNTTEDGDVLMLVRDGDHSKEFLFADGDTAILHLGHGMASILLSKTISIAAGVVTGATSITSTAFLGTIDGVVGGNTPAAITGTTIDAETDFTVGDTVITDGVITDSSGLQLAATVDIQGGYADGGGAPYDGVVDAAGGGNWTTLQAGDNALDAATNTVMLVKAGTYSTLTVDTDNVKIVCEPGTIATGAIVLSGDNITLVLGAASDIRGLITMSGDNCSLLCENGVDLEGITSSGDYNTIDGGGWDTISYIASGQSAITITGTGTTIQNISALEPTSNSYSTVGLSGSLHRCINVRSIESGGNGIAINATANEIYVANCRVDNCEGAGIMSNGPRNVITGNIVLNAGTYGIRITDTGDNTVVTGNIVKDSAGVALFANDAALDCVVSGNRFDGAITEGDGTGTFTGNNLDAF